MVVRSHVLLLRGAACLTHSPYATSGPLVSGFIILTLSVMVGPRVRL